MIDLPLTYFIITGTLFLFNIVLLLIVGITHRKMIHRTDWAANSCINLHASVMSTLKTLTPEQQEEAKKNFEKERVEFLKQLGAGHVKA